LGKERSIADDSDEDFYGFFDLVGRRGSQREKILEKAYLFLLVKQREDMVKSVSNGC
jgi:hypothetical protein